MAPIDCHRYAFVTDATVDRVWEALTDRALARRYFFGLDVVSEWTPGGPITLHGPHGITVSGQVLSVEPPWTVVFAIEQGLGPCRFISWDLRDSAEGTVVRLTVDEVDGDSEEEAEDTWLPVLLSLQTLLSQWPGEVRLS